MSHSESAPPSALFKHCPRCAAARASEGDAVRFLCESCGFVYYYNVAVSSAVLIIGSDEQALFIRRARDPGKDKLALPGGFIDRGETAEHAAIREVREEAGVKLATVEFLASFPNLYTYRSVEYPVVDLFFTARVPSREASPLDDVSEIVWAPPSSLGEADLAFPSHARALEAYRRRRSA
ncbi:MAG TPA: NUDIX domain-containing protein [Polyangiaceae bacterium]|nr:NUDIX domain-containing protein [Polyangiaceae bacterium]